MDFSRQAASLRLVCTAQQIQDLLRNIQSAYRTTSENLCFHTALSLIGRCLQRRAITFKRQECNEKGYQIKASRTDLHMECIEKCYLFAYFGERLRQRRATYGPRRRFYGLLLVNYLYTIFLLMFAKC